MFVPVCLDNNGMFKCLHMSYLSTVDFKDNTSLYFPKRENTKRPVTVEERDNTEAMV